MRTVKFLPVNASYGEAFNYGFTYSSLSPKRLVAKHAPVNCKDFLTDIWWSEYLGKPSGNVYGFTWEPGILPSTDPIRRIALRYKNVRISEYREGLGRFLREFDKGQGASPAEVSVANKGTALVVSFDSFWTSRPYLLSAYTSLMRMGFGYEGNDVPKYLKNNKFLCPIDKQRSSHINHRLLAILDGKTWEQSYEDYSAAYLAHNGGGILSWGGFR